MPERKRRTLWNTALKALAAALAVAALLVLGTFLCATPQVRKSRFGERIEQRFPIGWSEIALALGREGERLGAVATLRLVLAGRPPRDESKVRRRALGLLEKAAQDRSPEVRYRATAAIASELSVCLLPEARKCLVRLCHHPDPGVRAEACSYLLQHLLHYRQGPQRGLVSRLRRADAECTDRTTRPIEPPLPGGRSLSPAMARALQDCLRSSAPGGHTHAALISGAQERAQFAARIANARSFEEFRHRLGSSYAGPEGRVDALILLWQWRAQTPTADRLLREELTARPLTEAPGG